MTDISYEQSDLCAFNPLMTTVLTCMRMQLMSNMFPKDLVLIARCL